MRGMSAFVAPTGLEMMVAEELVNRPAVVGAYASSEWDEVGEDGQVWLAALIRECRRFDRERIDALEIGLSNLVALLADTGFHNSLEMATARKLIAADDPK
jgi:hypothetical protein